MQLTLRSINSSRSAYASISFIDTFFDAHNIFGASVVQAGVLAKVERHASVMLLIREDGFCIPLTNMSG